jgi:hypothetical protein
MTFELIPLGLNKLLGGVLSHATPPSIHSFEYAAKTFLEVV